MVKARIKLLGLGLGLVLVGCSSNVDTGTSDTQDEITEEYESTTEVISSCAGVGSLVVGDLFLDEDSIYLPKTENNVQFEESSDYIRTTVGWSKGYLIDSELLELKKICCELYKRELNSGADTYDVVLGDLDAEDYSNNLGGLMYRINTDGTIDIVCRVMVYQLGLETVQVSEETFIFSLEHTANGIELVNMEEGV